MFKIEFNETNLNREDCCIFSNNCIASKVLNGKTLVRKVLSLLLPLKTFIPNFVALCFQVLHLLVFLRFLIPKHWRNAFHTRHFVFVKDSLRTWQARTHCCRPKCFPVCPHAQHLLRTQILCPGHKKCFWFCSETFCVRNKCFPVCAAQETLWATMYQGL